jgi:hypothetical protein
MVRANATIQRLDESTKRRTQKFASVAGEDLVEIPSKVGYRVGRDPDLRQCHLPGRADDEGGRIAGLLADFNLNLDSWQYGVLRILSGGKPPFQPAIFCRLKRLHST